MTAAGVSTALIEALNVARRAEKAQAHFYHALAGCAEVAGDVLAADRLNGLLADEQHHYSRLSARLLELDQPVPDVIVDPDTPAFAEWEDVAREREQREIERYRSLLSLDADARTAVMIREFLAAELRHAEELGGKWMGA